jgi:hypothetical protein
VRLNNIVHSKRNICTDAALTDDQCIELIKKRMEKVRRVHSKQRSKLQKIDKRAKGKLQNVEKCKRFIAFATRNNDCTANVAGDDNHTMSPNCQNNEVAGRSSTSTMQSD